MTVITFKKPEVEPEEIPHISGDAICSNCNNQWVAVAPVGTDDIECPECRTFRANFKYFCAPSDDSPIFQCNCGETLFWITPKGCLCRGCGVIADFG